LFLAALERTTPTNASLLIAMNPVFTVLLAAALGDVLTGRQIAGVVVALAGAGVVISNGGLAALGELGSHAGDLLALAAALCWCCFNVASHRVVGTIAPGSANLVCYSLGAVGLTILGCGDDLRGQLARIDLTALGGIAFMAIGSSVIAGQLFLI